MAPKLDVGVLLLVSVTILQVTYTTWSVFSGQWSTTSRSKLSYAISQRPVKAVVQIATNSTSPVFGHRRKVSAMRYKNNSGSDDSSYDLRDSKIIFDAHMSNRDDRNPMLSELKSLSAYKMTFLDDSTTLAHNLRLVSGDQKSDNSKFLLAKPNACDGSPLVVIIVCSAAENSALRNAIRQTWASQPEPDLKTLFLVGRHGNASIDSSISSEDARNDDIIRLDFVDSYANLSLKSTLMLSWMLRHCSAAKFLVKTDDDTFLNTPLLLRDLRLTVHRRFIMGNVIALAKPVRTPNSKWFTPLSAYNRSAYPTYVSGSAYVIYGGAIAELYSASRKVPLFWLEDVYVTGLLAGSAKIPLIFNGKFDGFKDLLDVCSMRFHTVRHRISADQMHLLWSIVFNNFTRKCL